VKEHALSLLEPYPADLMVRGRAGHRCAIDSPRHQFWRCPMPYSVNITALDLSGGVPDVRITAGYTWTEVGGPQAVERRQDEVSVVF
jgi:hypothetical protein